MKVPIPGDWNGTDWCRFSICWPDSQQWRGLLHGVLTIHSRGRFWDENTGSIRDVQVIGQQIRDNNIPLKEVIMACGDTELTAAFNSIATAIRYLADKQCCDNLQIDIQGGFQGTITQGSGEVIPIYGSEPPGEMPAGQFPPEYENEAAYLADKCRKANALADGVITTLQNIAGFGTFNAITLAALILAAMASSIVFPPALIPTAISVLVILSGSLFLIAQLAAALIENREEFVCILYEGETVAIIIETLSGFLDVLIASIPVSGTLAWALKALFLTLNNTNNLNRLFSGEPAIGYPDVDCSVCAPACDVFAEVQFGEVTDGSFQGCGVTMAAAAVDINFNRIDVKIWTDDQMTTPTTLTLTELITSPSPLSHSNPSGANIYRLYDTNLQLIHNSDNPPALPFEFHAISIVASNAGFHVDMLFE